MRGPARAWAMLTVAVLTTLVSGPLTAAYDAGPPDARHGYPANARVLHDCGDDYGVSANRADELGHDLVALDMKEANERVHFYIRYARGPDSTEDKNPGGVANLQVPYRLFRLHFDGPSGHHETGAWIHYDRYETLQGYTSHDGMDRTPYQPPADGGGTDPARRVLELWFNHDSLGLRNGDVLRNITLHTATMPASGQEPNGDPDQEARWADADTMGYPGAPPAAPCPNGGADSLLVSNFTIRHSPVSNRGPTTTPPTLPSVPVYTADPVSLAATFTDPDGDEINQWEWTMGDGTTYRTPAVEHAYADDGTYPVSVRARDALGAWGEPASIDIEIRNRDPIADLAIEPRDPLVGQVVNFTDRSRDSDGQIAHVSWHFGYQGQSSTDRNAVYAYARAGTFTVTLTVRDDDGATTQIHRDIIVRRQGEGPQDAVPTADFDYSPGSPLQGNPVQFEDRSLDPEGQLVAWTWDFGDGTTADVPDPIHTFDSPGTFTVTLTVRDAAGLVASRQRPVVVTGLRSESALVTPDFDYSPDAPRAGGDIAFFDQSSVEGTTIVSWRWDFGDGSPTKSERNPNHRYDQPGQYTVTLALVDASAAQHQVTRLVDVQSEPAATDEQAAGAAGANRRLPALAVLPLAAACLALAWHRRERLPRA